MATTFASLESLLTAYKAYQLSGWSQAGRDEAGTGVCIGMCLDWLRRVYTPRKVAKSGFGRGVSAMHYDGSKDSFAVRLFGNKSAEKRSSRFKGILGF